MSQYIDFRSDTVSLPTRAMREAIANAKVGDDTLGDDPTVKKLEKMGAHLLGKEAAVFVVSGTMANQLAVMTVVRPGEEILLAERSHLYNLEAGGVAALSGAQVKVLKDVKGHFSLDEIEKAIRPKGIQSPVTRMLCLENTFDLNRGIPLPPSYITRMAEIACEKGLFCYLDGARLFNAAVAFGVSPKDICRSADAVMVVLTKGLAAPMGALLAGNEQFVKQARFMRQRIGGGLRQAGYMAAAGIVALETMIDRLSEDHENAKLLAEGLISIGSSLIESTSAKTNIVQLCFEEIGIPASDVVEDLLKRQIRIKPIGRFRCRMVTHRGISRDDVFRAVEEIRSILKDRKRYKKKPG